MRVLVISWEYPPIIEGGLARHVRKLSEHLVGEGVEVHVLTRGGGRLPATEEGDVFLIANAGAYGRVMSSHYNLREPAGEALLS